MKLLKLEVSGEMHCVYNFDEKINVLLGANGTGKSTFVKLILYSLGAPIKSFIDEISVHNKCDNVTLDVECKSGKQFRILRKLPSSEIIIVTPIKDTKELVNDEIQAFNLEEFSDFLLENEEYSNEKIPFGKDKIAGFRFYFLLRALYVDQETSAHQILSNIEMNADYITSQPLIKKNIIEKLIGTDDIELQRLRLTLQELNKEQAKLGVEINFLKDQISKNHKDKYEIEKVKERLTEIEAEKEFLTKQEFEKTIKVKALNDDVISEKMIKLQKDLNKYQTKLQTTILEIGDIEDVVKKLEEDLVSLNYKIAAEEILNELPLLYCPNCLSPLDQDIINKGICENCKNKTLEENIINNATIKRTLLDSIVEAKEVKDYKLASVEEYKFEIHKIEECIYAEQMLILNKNKDDQSSLLLILNEIKERLEQIIRTENNLKEYLILISNLQQKESVRKMNIVRMGEIKNALLEKDTELQKTNNRLVKFQEIFNNYCSVIFPDVGNCVISDNMMPLIQGKKMTEIPSASMRVAIRLSFLTALLNYPLYLENIESNHLNILFLDSPRDKELDVDRFAKYLKILNKESFGQIIITGSSTDKDVYLDNLKNAKYFEELTDEKRLLSKEVSNTET